MGPSEVVDNDFSSSAAKEESIFSADACSSTGDNHDLAVESESHHKVKISNDVIALMRV